MRHPTSDSCFRRPAAVVAQAVSPANGESKNFCHALLNLQLTGTVLFVVKLYLGNG
jgi:hypothetical protein